MTRKEFFKSILKEIGFNSKKFLFFTLIALLAFGVYFIWQKIRPIQASVELSPSIKNSQNINIDVEVTKNGQVSINGEKQNDALKFYSDYDELKIIVAADSGNYIQSFNGQIHLPEPVKTGQVRQIIHAAHGVGAYNSYLSDSKTLTYTASSISSHATLTIVADFPKGYIKPNVSQKLDFIIGVISIKNWLYIAIALPLITIILMTVMLIKRRSARLFTVSALMDKLPSENGPAIVGVLIDGAVGAREIAATLISLARRGYLLIINKGNGQFSFGKRKDSNSKLALDLQKYERVLLDKIFFKSSYKSTLDDVEMRIGRHIFSRKIAQYYLGIYNEATNKGYFVKNPAKVHLIYKYTGIGLLVLSLIGFAFGAITSAEPKFSLLFWVGGMLAAFFVIKFSPYMPARSKTGTQELVKWLAFRNYLTAKKNIQGQDAILAKFEEYLPYAIALGAEVEWANRFSNERFTKPEWYESAENVVTLESFTGEFYPFIGYVAENLAKSHEPTVE